MNLVSRNGDIIVWEIPARNLSPYTINNVVVTDTSSLGTQYIGHTASKGTFDPITGIWNVGKLLGKESAVLKLTVKVIDITQAPFTNTATGNANQPELDLSNNTYIQTVNTTTCAPACGGSDIENGCICFNLLDFVTPCTHGETEFELDNIQNGELLGDLPNATISYIDPTLPVLISYTIFCNVGVDRTECSSGTYQIGPILKSKDIFNHTIEQVECGELTQEQKIVLQDQYPGLVIDEYCWTVIKNGNGDTTSGIPLNCDETKDTKTTFECVVGDYDPELFENLVTYPENPEDGDIHIVLFDNGILTTNYNSISENTGDWVVHCFKNYCCGTSTGIQSIVEGDNITVDNTDPQNPVVSANITALGDDWGTQVIQHSSTSISEGDGTVASPLNVEIYQEVTYTELQTLITDSELIPGKKYLLIDYQTVHQITNTTDINTGPIEPLLITAMGTNELEPIAYSTTYPDDIIYYNPVNDSTKITGSTKGYIYKRIDTNKRINAPLDWRNVLYRRWAVGHNNPYNEIDTFNFLEVVNDGDDLYVSLLENNQGNLLIDEDSWGRISFFKNGDFMFFKEDGMTGVGSDRNLLIINANPISYTDYTIFSNISITPQYYHNVEINVGWYNDQSNSNIIDLFNNVFLLECRNNIIHARGVLDFSNNTFKSVSQYMLLGTGNSARNICTIYNCNHAIDGSIGTYTNNIGSSFFKGCLGYFDKNNGGLLQDIYVFGHFKNNIINNYALRFVVSNDFKSNIINSYFTSGNSELNTSVLGSGLLAGFLKFNIGSHVDNNYSKTWYQKEWNGVPGDITVKLEYRDNTDTLVTDLVTN